MCHRTQAVQGVLGGCAWEVVCMCHGTLAVQGVLGGCAWEIVCMWMCSHTG